MDTSPTGVRAVPLHAVRRGRKLVRAYLLSMEALLALPPL